MDPFTLTGAAVAGLSFRAPEIMDRIGKTMGWLREPQHEEDKAIGKAKGEAKGNLAQVQIYRQAGGVGKPFLGALLKRHKNMENVTVNAMPLIKDTANPQEVEKDWITHFFEKCCLISEEKTQMIWSKILAGEMNVPGAFSKRTISTLSLLSSSEAALFKRMAEIAFKETRHPFYLPSIAGPIFTNEDLEILELAGLIKILPDDRTMHIDYGFHMEYFGRTIQFRCRGGAIISKGKVIFTEAGRQLKFVSSEAPLNGYFDNMLKGWSSVGACEVVPLAKGTSSDYACRFFNDNGNEEFSNLSKDQFYHLGSKSNQD